MNVICLQYKQKPVMNQASFNPVDPVKPDMK